MLEVNFSWSEFFTMDPVMTGAYVLVGGVGLVCIGAGWLESRLLSGPFAYVSKTINGLLNIGLPVSYAIMLIRLFAGF
jgi:hypothetical protein